MPDSIDIINAYGAVLEREARRLLGVVDVECLPFPKRRILASIYEQLSQKLDAESRRVLEIGAVDLAQFQEGVGAEPVYQNGIDLSKLPEANKPEQGRKNAEAIVAMAGAHTSERQAIFERARKEQEEILRAVQMFRRVD